MNDQEPLVTTSSQTVGPFFHFGMVTLIGSGAAPAAADESIRITLRVLDGDGLAVADALVEYWHAVARGSGTACGRTATTDDGSCEIETARPASHLNLCIFSRGLLRHLFTRVYFDGDPALASDPVMALVPEDRRSTLIASRDAASAGAWRFDIHLQGSRETVFFDQ